MNEITREWVRKADSDFDQAHLAMEASEEPLTDGVCFHSQQCAEKYLKACLQERQVEFPRRHPLLPLLALCLPLDPAFESLEDDLNTLDRYAVAIRYPGMSASVEEAEAALAASRRVRTFVRSRLGLT